MLSEILDLAEPRALSLPPNSLLSTPRMPPDDAWLAPACAASSATSAAPTSATCFAAPLMPAWAVSSAASLVACLAMSEAMSDAVPDTFAPPHPGIIDAPMPSRDEPTAPSLCMSVSSSPVTLSVPYTASCIVGYICAAFLMVASPRPTPGIALSPKSMMESATMAASSPSNQSFHESSPNTSCCRLPTVLSNPQSIMSPPTSAAALKKSPIPPMASVRIFSPLCSRPVVSACSSSSKMRSISDLNASSSASASSPRLLRAISTAIWYL